MPGLSECIYWIDNRYLLRHYPHSPCFINSAILAEINCWVYSEEARQGPPGYERGAPLINASSSLYPSSSFTSAFTGSASPSWSSSSNNYEALAGIVTEIANQTRTVEPTSYETASIVVSASPSHSFLSSSSSEFISREGPSAIIAEK